MTNHGNTLISMIEEIESLKLNDNEKDYLPQGKIHGIVSTY